LTITFWWSTKLESIGASPKINPGLGSQVADSDFSAVESDSISQSAAEQPFRYGFVGRVSKGMGALSLGSAVNIVSQITIVPVALYAWGKFRYGEWILLTGLVQLVKLTDLGLQTYVVNRLCAAHAHNDRQQLQRVLHSAVRVQLPVVLSIYGGLAIVLVSVPWAQVLGLHTISGARLVGLGLLLSGELLLGVPMGTIAGVYRAIGRLARAAVIGACQQFSILSLSLLLIASDIADRHDLAEIRELARRTEGGRPIRGAPAPARTTVPDDVRAVALQVRAITSR